MTLNQEELAWAAGFFDGEGWAGTQKQSVTKHLPTRRYRAVLSVSQKNPSLLYRFREAVGGCGKIRHRRIGRRYERYQYDIGGRDVIDVLSSLWPRLGHIKRYQALEALQTVWDMPPGRQGQRPLSTHCRNGHERTLENTYRWKGWQYCRVCMRERTRNWRARRA